MRVLICDDSNAYALALQQNLETIFKDLSIEATFIVLNHLSDLKQDLEAQKADILFLDIIMDGESAIDWWLTNTFVQSPKMVLMTSVPEEAYKLSQISHALFMVKAKTDMAYLKTLVQQLIAAVAKTPSDLITVTFRGTTYTLRASKILYIESFGNNLLIHSKQETVKIRYTIRGILKKLPVCFLRIHKSYIINMNFVVRTKPNQFVLDGEIALRVNPRKFSELEAQYKKYITLL